MVTFTRAVVAGLERMMETGQDDYRAKLNDKDCDKALKSFEKYGSSWIDYDEIDELWQDPQNHEYLKALLDVQDNHTGGAYPIFYPSIATQLRQKFLLDSTHQTDVTPVAKYLLTSAQESSVSEEDSIIKVSEFDTNEVDNRVGFTNKDFDNPPPVLVRTENYNEFGGYNIMTTDAPDFPGAIRLIQKLEPVEIHKDGEVIDAYRFVFETTGGTQKTLLLEREGLANISFSEIHNFGWRGPYADFPIGYRLDADGLLHEIEGSTTKGLQELAEQYDITFRDPPEEAIREHVDLSFLGGKIGMGVWRDDVYLGDVRVAGASKESVEIGLQEVLREQYPNFLELKSKVLSKYNVNLTKLDGPKDQMKVSVAYADNNYPMFEMTSLGSRFSLNEFKKLFGETLKKSVTITPGAQNILEKYRANISADGLTFESGQQDIYNIYGNKGEGWNANIKIDVYTRSENEPMEVREALKDATDVLVLSWTDTKTKKDARVPFDIQKMFQENYEDSINPQ